MLIDICIKFCENSLHVFQVIEWTRFVTDRQTDGWTDRRTDRQTDTRGKTICLQTLKGGDINKDMRPVCMEAQQLLALSNVIFQMELKARKPDCFIQTTNAQNSMQSVFSLSGEYSSQNGYMQYFTILTNLCS